MNFRFCPFGTLLSKRSGVSPICLTLVALLAFLPFFDDKFPSTSHLMKVLAYTHLDIILWLNAAAMAINRDWNVLLSKKKKPLAVGLWWYLEDFAMRSNELLSVSKGITRPGCVRWSCSLDYHRLWATKEAQTEHQADAQGSWWSNNMGLWIRRVKSGKRQPSVMRFPSMEGSLDRANSKDATVSFSFLQQATGLSEVPDWAT